MVTAKYQTWMVASSCSSSEKRCEDQGKSPRKNLATLGFVISMIAKLATGSPGVFSGTHLKIFKPDDDVFEPAFNFQLKYL